MKKIFQVVKICPYKIHNKNCIEIVATKDTHEEAVCAIEYFLTQEQTKLTPRAGRYITPELTYTYTIFESWACN